MRSAEQISLCLGALVLLSWSNAVFAAPRLDMQLLNKQVDLGDINRGADMEPVFELKNLGDAALVVRRVICSSGKPKLSSHVVLPGEAEQLTVVIPTRRLKGPLKCKCWVLTNDPDNSRPELLVTANVLWEVECQPKEIRFSEKPISLDIHRKIVVSLPSGVELLKITSSPSDCVILGHRREWVEGQHRVFEIPMTITETKQIGSFLGHITVETTSKVEPHIRIPIEGSVGMDSRLVPPSLFFGVVYAGRVYQHTLKFESFASPLARVVAVRSKYGVVQPALRQTSGDSPNSETFIDVALDSSRLEGNVADVLQIVTTDPMSPEFLVPVSPYVARR